MNYCTTVLGKGLASLGQYIFYAMTLKIFLKRDFERHVRTQCLKLFGLTVYDINTH